MIMSATIHLPTLVPAPHVAYPWYARRRRRSLISTSEDIQTFSTDCRINFKDVGITLQFVGACLPSRCGSLLPSVPAKPLVPLYKLHARTPREHDRLSFGEASGRSTDATLALALGPKEKLDDEQ